MRPWRLAVVSGLMLLGSGGAGRAAAPSFDCGRAHTAVETAICRDAGLSRSDAAMARAYQALSYRLSPAASAALAKDQRWFLQARDFSFGFYPEHATDMLRDLMARRIRFLSRVDVAQAGQLAGHWGNVTGRVDVSSVAGGGLKVRIDTAEPAVARWVCSMSGTGTPVNGMLQIKDGNGPVVTLARDGETLRVAVANPGNDDGNGGYCGHNGSVEGTYFPLVQQSKQGRAGG